MPDELLYVRQESVRLFIPDSITIAGAGGVGSWVAILSSMVGIKQIYLFDHDTLEEHNRNRLPFCQGSLNKNKVDVVQDYIAGIRPDCIIVGIPEKLEGVLLTVQLSLTDIVIDCTDSPKAQINNYNQCKKVGKRFIRAGYDYDLTKQDFHITVSSSVSGWIKTDEEEAQYTVTPSWVAPALVAANGVMVKMCKEPNLEISTYLQDIGKLILPKASRLTARCQQSGSR